MSKGLVSVLVVEGSDGGLHSIRGSAGKEIAMEVEHHSGHFLRARQSDVSLFQDDVFAGCTPELW